MARLIARYDSAWNGRDSVGVERLLAAEYQYFTSVGGLSSRAESMGFLTSPEYRLEQANRSELRVRVTGPVAIASSRWQGRGSFQGKPFVDDQRCGHTWVRAGRGWQLLSEHCAQIVRQAPSN